MARQMPISTLTEGEHRESTECCDTMVSSHTLYFGGPRFNFWPKEQINWLKFFMSIFRSLPDAGTEP